MQKALVELERGGLIYTNRTSGRYITEDKELIGETKHYLAKNQSSEFLEKMKQLGFMKQDIITILLEAVKELEQS